MSKKITPSKGKSPSTSKKDGKSPSKSPSKHGSDSKNTTLDWIETNFLGISNHRYLSESPRWLFSSYGGARSQLSLGAFKSLDLKIGDVIKIYYKDANTSEIRLSLCTVWPLSETPTLTETQTLPHSIIIDDLITSSVSIEICQEILKRRKQKQNPSKSVETETSESGKQEISEEMNLDIDLNTFHHQMAIIEPLRSIPDKAKKLQLTISLSNDSSKGRTFDNNEIKQLKNYLMQFILFNGALVSYKNIPNSMKIEITASEPSGFVQVTHGTELSIIVSNNQQEEENSKKIPETSNEVCSIGGLDSSMNMLREIVKLPFLFPHLFKYMNVECPKGILLKGPPGVGKTLMVQNVANESKAKLFIINGPEIISPVVGETEKQLREIFSEASKFSQTIPTIIFIDEIDALCPRRTEQHTVESRFVTQMLTLMDGINTIDHNSNNRANTIVIAATNRPNAIDPALRRPGRFDREIEIEVPNVQQRLEILKVHTRDMPLEENVDLGIVDNKFLLIYEEYLSNQLPGYVGADIAALCREAALRAIRRYRAHLSNSEDIPLSKVKLDDFEHALSIVVPSTQRESAVDFSKISWERVGGYQDIKKRLRQVVEWPLLKPEIYRRFNLSPPKGILLHGPSGCGKTLLVRALVSNLRVSFLTLNGASVFSPYVGDAESIIRDTFRKARMGSPSILFIDELESLVGNRSIESSSGGVQERVLATLLNEMDGVEALNDVLIVAATNRIDMIDNAVLRPGRIDIQLHIPTPDFYSRQEILKLYMEGVPIDSDVDLNAVAAKTENFSGGDIENLCREASILALREEFLNPSVKMKNFTQALEEILPNTKERGPNQQTMYKFL